VDKDRHPANHGLVQCSFDRDGKFGIDYWLIDEPPRAWRVRPRCRVPFCRRSAAWDGPAAERGLCKLHYVVED